MMDQYEEARRAYRVALCTLTTTARLEIEYELLAELKQRVLQAQMNHDRLGGQSRMDSIELCLAELEKDNG